MFGFSEESLESDVAPWAQRLIGAVLLLATSLAIWYAVTTLIELRSPTSSNDDPIWFGVLILALTPFLLTLTVRLLAGRMRQVEVFPPVALIVAGAVLIVGGTWLFFDAPKSGVSPGRMLLVALLGGVWIRIGVRRLNRPAVSRGDA